MTYRQVGDGPLFSLREVAPVPRPAENHPEAYCQTIDDDFQICGEELLKSGACPKGHK